VTGVYRVDPETKDITLETALHPRPNGLAFDHRERVLWVADSSIRCTSWTAYEIFRGTPLDRREAPRPSLDKAACEVIPDCGSHVSRPQPLTY